MFLTLLSPLRTRMKQSVSLVDRPKHAIFSIRRYCFIKGKQQLRHSPSMTRASLILTFGALSGLSLTKTVAQFATFVKHPQWWLGKYLCRKDCKTLIHEDSALFLLHSEDAPATSLDYNGSGPVVANAASSLALRTATRIAVDVARNFNDNLAKVNMIARPPTYCYIIYRATIELISLRDSMDRTQWSQDLEILREASWNYSRRWQVAGMPALSSIN